MTTDTENQDQADPTVSPDEADLQSANEDGNRIEQLEAELADYKQRLGNAVRVNGEELKTLESQYQAWATNAKQYYDELAASKDSTIDSLESKLVELSDSDGAKAVLEEQRNRREEESAKRDARAATEAARQQELNTALETALKTFPDLTAEDFKDVHSAETVWQRARTANEERTKQTMETMMETLRSEFKNEFTTGPLEDPEVARQEPTSRTPGSSSQPVVNAPTAHGANKDPRFTQLEQLRVQLAEAKQFHKLSVVVATNGNIRALELELKSEGLM